MKRNTYQLDLTTQGPLYPPSEVMDEDGNFIVIGAINQGTTDGSIKTDWGNAIVSANSPVPEFGSWAPYEILSHFGADIPDEIGRKILHTLPLPLPCANYPIVFAPGQHPNANSEQRPSYPFHETPIPDIAPEHGRKRIKPVTLSEWARASGELTVTLEDDDRQARFEFDFDGLLANSLYTVMSLRQNDLNPVRPSRPGPLGIPNVFVTNADGTAQYEAVMPDPFPAADAPRSNRIINVVVLWMSYQMSHGGAIGRYGLGGDIHAQLKFRQPMFSEFVTHA